MNFCFGGCPQTSLSESHFCAFARPRGVSRGRICCWRRHRDNREAAISATICSLSSRQTWCDDVATITTRLNRFCALQDGKATKRLRNLYRHNGLWQDGREASDKAIAYMLEQNSADEPYFHQEWHGMNPTTPIISGGMNALRIPGFFTNLGHSNVIMTAGDGVYGHIDGRRPVPNRCVRPSNAGRRTRTCSNSPMSTGSSHAPSIVSLTTRTSCTRTGGRNSRAPHLRRTDRPDQYFLVASGALQYSCSSPGGIVHKR